MGGVSQFQGSNWGWQVVFSRRFNSVRKREERRGPRNEVSQNSREIREFNNFLELLEVEDIPLNNRKFTWFRSGGHSKSRIDRVVVSQGWLEKWPNSAQYILKRSVSDHCPVLLKYEEVNWGARPFRFLNYWLEDGNFIEVIKEKWAELNVDGWGSFVLKEKLRSLKGEIKEWKKDDIGEVRKGINKALEEINRIDELDDAVGVGEAEISKRKELMAEFWKLSNHNESILWQRSRCKWVMEGDRNTKYFHACINKRRVRNQLSGVKIGDVWVEDPIRVKEGVAGFFESRYKESCRDRPTLDGVHFRSLREEDKVLLDKKN